MSLIDRVSSVLREAAVEAVMPRFRKLDPDEVAEKAPGELVTIADRESEAIIAAGLGALRPDARFVGEEACSREPDLLEKLDQGWVWVVDPIDGTANFAAGKPPFAIMAALLHNGRTTAAWLLDPLADILIVAEQGGGAWRNGARLSSAAPVEGGRWRGIASQFFRPHRGDAIVSAIASGVAEIVPSRRCAGAEYPAVAAGEIDFAVYWRSLVWDHAPGALVVEEAGGAVTRLDGRRYRPGVPGEALIVARSHDVAMALAEAAARA